MPHGYRYVADSGRQVAVGLVLVAHQCKQTTDRRAMRLAALVLNSFVLGCSETWKLDNRGEALA